MHDKLSKLSGTAFDRSFAREMVADHEKDIAAFQREAKKKNAGGQLRQSDAANITETYR